MKVVFFDYWTKGLRNFIQLNQELKKEGVDCFLLHTGSFREASDDIKSVQEINGVKCVEISSLNTDKIYNAIEQIKPDVVISLNTTYILDRALVLSCRKFDVRLMFMMHGDRATGDQISEVVKSSKAGLLYKAIKMIRYAGFYIPNYLYTLRKCTPKRFYSFFPIKVLYSYFRNPALSRYYPKYADELIHDECLIYTNKYVDYYTKVGYKKEQITKVGKPELDPLFQKIIANDFPKDELPDKVKSLVENGEKYAVYVENSYPEVQQYGWDDDYRNEHLQAVESGLKLKGYKMVIKLHPTVDERKIKVKDSILIKKCDNATLMYYSEFAIVHASSVNEVPVILNKPVVFPRWGKSKGIVDYFESWGITNDWEDPMELPELKLDQKNREKYINEVVTFSDGNSMQRIIDHILKH
jgi:hypothetical protein